MIEIKEVTSRYMMRKFCNFPLKLYKGNPYYIPCFFDDEMALFGKKNVFSISAIRGSFWPIRTESSPEGSL